MSSISLFSLLTFIIFFNKAFCALELPVEINTYFKSSISALEERFILNVPEPDEQIMAIEYVFTNPSKYEKFTFNIYEKEEITSSENNTKHLRTFTDNETELISSDENINGKKVIYLNLNKEIKKIAFTIFVKENAPKTNADMIHIRYRIAKTKPLFFNIDSTKINILLEENILNLSFSGIKQQINGTNNENFKVSFVIRLFDKESIDNFITNPSAYYLLYAVKPLKELSFKLKGQTAGEKIYARLSAPLNNQEPQYIIVFAYVSFEQQQEYILYDCENLTIYDLSDPPIVGSTMEDKKKEDKNEETANKEKNKLKFYIIIGAFIGVIVFVFIFIMIYIAVNTKKGDKVEDNEDYKNVGAIIATINEDKA